MNHFVLIKNGTKLMKNSLKTSKDESNYRKSYTKKNNYFGKNKMIGFLKKILTKMTNKQLKPL
jgi:alpha-acetolactate decarboxylase